ncbi:MAG: MucB/RseB C-terminal domain-containing protein [Formivibrio sp.]|nr:MucB/RseB C-terminal domain-containing protein [Formivibrio sp.]
MSLRYLFIFITLWSGLATAAGELSSTESQRLLERIVRAPMLTSFQGVYVQQHGEYMETIRVCHVVDSGVVSERRETLDGPAREIVRHGDQVSVYLPEGGRATNFDPRAASHLFPSLLPDYPAEILANYTLRRGARERVAGMDADVIDLEPRDHLRYPHRLWVSVDTGLLLKTATLGFKHEMFDLYAFSQLVFGAQVDRNQLKPMHPMSLVSAESASLPPAVDSSLWDTKAIPAGFRLLQKTQRMMSGHSRPVIHHVYSDGLVTISVFIEAMQATSPLGSARQSGLSVYGKKEGNYHLMVMGEVPAETVELFANAYQLVDKQGAK